MPKEISRSEKPEFFLQGGKTKMFGKGHASEMPEGQSGRESQEGSGASDKFASGGSGKMFGKGHAGKKVPGISGKATQEG